MSRALLVLKSESDRQRAIRWINAAPFGCRVEFKHSKRTTDQNAKMWAALTDIAEQVVWHGTRLKASDWKLILMAALRQEMRIVPNIDGTGFVNLGVSTSDLSKTEMSDLLELIVMFGAKHGVKFHERAEQTA